MKNTLKVLVLFCITAVQSIQAQNRSIENLGEKISSVVNQFFPEESVQRDPQDVKLVISSSTMPFQIHNIDKSGKVGDQLHEEIGPNAGGFLIELAHQDGQYRGAAAYPQTLIRPYWKTYFTVIPIEVNQQHICISFSYGSKVPEDFISSITKILQADK